jgi:hypothetical protein
MMSLLDPLTVSCEKYNGLSIVCKTGNSHLYADQSDSRIQHGCQVLFGSEYLKSKDGTQLRMMVRLFTS